MIFVEYLRALNTHQLESCDVRFPPEIALHAGTKGGEEVVTVHDHVDERVNYAHRYNLFPCNQFTGKIFKKLERRYSLICIRILYI